MNTDVLTLKGVGPKLAERLAKLNIFTVQDLLFHLPYRYLDRTRVSSIRALKAKQYAVIEGEVLSSQIKFGKKRSLLYYLNDGTGSIALRFFHFSAAQQKQFKVGSRLRCAGEVRFGAVGFEMAHPECQFILPGEAVPVEKNLTPVYPTTEGLHQLSWRKLTDQALAMLSQNELDEHIPPVILKQYQLPDLKTALQFVHRPPAAADQMLLLSGVHPAQQRLAFEELLAHRLSLLTLRFQVKQLSAPSLCDSVDLTQQFLEKLAFQLTGAQQRVYDEIKQDLQKTSAMLRLVQGDVGSGKTVVAALSALQAVFSGFQAAVMAPTEILVEQHYQRFKEWFDPLGIDVTCLTGKQTAADRQKNVEKISSNSAQLIVGTHALFQQDVVFANLGLVVVDEQHRFGVHQRLAMRTKGLQGDQVPHQLIMTATPIPRTLAMTAYADLDCSIIDEMPAGRMPVKTVVISNKRRAEVIERIRSACQQGRQVYWVCTLIEESEVLQCQAAETAAQELQQTLSDCRVGLVHGRLKAQQKQAIMQAFKNGKLGLLVSTTVIEVGVDIPNASLMIIENPERLGLAQLHQLRGRVGRGQIESHCVLMYQPPISENIKRRLTIMRDHHDGFAIAQHDLELRGPGEVLGTRQTGLMQMKVADLLRDQHLLQGVQHAASVVLSKFPHSVQPLVNRWLQDREQYGTV